MAKNNLTSILDQLWKDSKSVINSTSNLVTNLFNSVTLVVGLREKTEDEKLSTDVDKAKDSVNTKSKKVKKERGLLSKRASVAEDEVQEVQERLNEVAKEVNGKAGKAVDFATGVILAPIKQLITKEDEKRSDINNVNFPSSPDTVRKEISSPKSNNIKSK